MRFLEIPYTLTGSLQALFGVLNAMVIGMVAASGKLGKKTENGIWDLRRVILGTDAVKLVSPLRTRTIPYSRIDSIVAREADDAEADRDTREKVLLKGSRNQTLAVVRLDIVNFGEMVDELIRRVTTATSREKTRVASNHAARVRQLTIRRKRLIRWGAAFLVFFVLLGAIEAWMHLENRRFIAGSKTTRAIVKTVYAANHRRHRINYSFEDDAGRSVLGSGEVPLNQLADRTDRTVWIYYDPLNPQRNQPVENIADGPAFVLLCFLCGLPFLGMMLYGHFGIAPERDAANVSAPR